MNEWMHERSCLPFFFSSLTTEESRQHRPVTESLSTPPTSCCNQSLFYISTKQQKAQIVHSHHYSIKYKIGKAIIDHDLAQQKTWTNSWKMERA